MTTNSRIKSFYGGPWRSRKEQNKQQVEAKWIGTGGVKLAHPADCSDLETVTEKKLLDVCKGKVCEVGCGTGRIAKYFSPSKYLGLDINHAAIAVAEKKYPKHKFDLIMWESLYPTADTYLFFTVLMHIPDGEVFHIIKKLDRRVVVVESLGRWLRDYGRGNNYQRDPFEYRDLFKQIGMSEIEYHHCFSFHYPFYLDIMVFE